MLWKKPKKMGTARKLFNRVAGPVVVLGIVFHGATQIAYTTHNFWLRNFPTEERASFEETLGFSVIGWKSDVEDSEGNLAMISEVVSEERYEKDFELDNIEIVSSNYLKRKFSHQMDQIFRSKGLKGRCVGKRIYLFDFDKETNEIIHHEIKHIKSEAIFNNHRELIREWGNIEKNKDGESLYLGLEENLRRYKGLESLIKEEYNPYPESLGFVSNDAMKNIYEDIAETATMAEISPNSFISWLYGNETCSQENFRISKKVSLAQKYGLIPAEFSDFVYVLREFKNLKSSHHFGESISKGSLGDFIEVSDEFLRENPDSVYECYVRTLRGDAYKLYVSDQNLEYSALAIREFKEALNSDFKPKKPYILSLIGLVRSYHEDVKDDNLTKMFQGAIEEYERRYNANDITLSKTGVNDYLIEKGILLND